MEISRKLEKGEKLTPEEQSLASKWKLSGPKLCGHNGCTNKLPPRVDGRRNEIKKVEVCDDCYFGDLGDELEMYPMAHGIRRRG